MMLFDLNRKYSFALLFFVLLVVLVIAQEDKKSIPADIEFFGFIDAYYVYDFNQPSGDSRQPFLFNHNRHNEFNLNLGLIKAAVMHSKYRANLALQAGTYAQDNYAAEQDLLKHVFEANAGVALNKKNKLWLDAGIFSSHLGFESAISSENMTLTRSLFAESAPYFLAGTKLTYQPNEHWEIMAVITNGWQRIQRVKGNSLPGFGTQLNYSQESFTVNWSTFIGTDDPDHRRRMRYFNNFYGQFNVSSKTGLIAGLDVGLQESLPGSSRFHSWYTPVLIVRHQFHENWAFAVRGEYFEDEHGEIISSRVPRGFRTSGVSLNVDYSPFENVVCRVEGRWFNSPDKEFINRSVPDYNNVFVAGSIAAKF